MVLDEIVSIKKVGNKKTVDIEVDGPDSLFWCNGILTHNSAAGDTADVSEENIQGGISKIQAADNVLAFIPNAQSRETGVMRAKFLKTRDSGGTNAYVDFKVDWSTLTFDPWSKEDGDVPELNSPADNVRNNLPSPGSDSFQVKKTTKGKSSSIKKKDDDDDDTDESSGSSTRKAIRNIGGKKRPMNKQKNVKLI